MVSVCGYTGLGPAGRNKELVHEIAEFTAELRNAHWVVGGDWQFPPEEWDLAGGAKLGAPVA